jgi:hypothetical protein
VCARRDCAGDCKIVRWGDWEIAVVRAPVAAADAHPRRFPASRSVVASSLRCARCTLAVESRCVIVGVGAQHRAEAAGCARVRMSL